MKKLLVVAGMVFLCSLGSLKSGYSYDPQGSDEGANYPDKWHYCPYCGSRLDNNDDTQAAHYWGLMHSQHMKALGWQEEEKYHQDTAEKPEPLIDEQHAKSRVQGYLDDLGNPNLKLGKINETTRSFEVEIVTLDNSLVDKIKVNKKTGDLRSIYE